MYSSTESSDGNTDNNNDSNSDTEDHATNTIARRVSQKRLPGQFPQMNAKQSIFAGKRLPKLLPFHDSTVIGPQRLPSPIEHAPQQLQRRGKRVRFSEPVVSEIRWINWEDRLDKAGVTGHERDVPKTASGSGLRIKLLFWNSFKREGYLGLKEEQARFLLRDVAVLQGTFRDLVTELEGTLERETTK